MRVLLTVALLLGVTSSAFAQQTDVRRKPDTDVRRKPDTTTATIAGSSLPRQSREAAETGGCWPVTSRDRVVVEMNEGSARTGTLLCMGPEEIMLTGSGTLPLSSIRQISKPKDSALDGVLKGAAVGLVILAFCAPDCPGEYVVRATIGYATIGGIMDALQGNNKTIYRRDPKAAVAWRVRF
jgi:hypothetical protein